MNDPIDNWLQSEEMDRRYRYMQACLQRLMIHLGELSKQLALADAEAKEGINEIRFHQWKEHHHE
jgi:hypothetical protein